MFFSCAVLEVGDGVFEVLSTSGDTHMGGDDFDKVETRLTSSSLYHLYFFLNYKNNLKQRIVNWLAENFTRDVGIDLRKDKLFDSEQY